LAIAGGEAKQISNVPTGVSDYFLYSENESITANSDLYVMPAGRGMPSPITTNKAYDATPSRSSRRTSMPARNIRCCS